MCPVGSVARRRAANVYAGTAMARNPNQFRKGPSETDFLATCGTEERCVAALEHVCRLEGFRCPHCDRFNRRNDVGSMVRRLTCAAQRTPPAPCTALTQAEPPG